MFFWRNLLLLLYLFFTGVGSTPVYAQSSEAYKVLFRVPDSAVRVVYCKGADTAGCQKNVAAQTPASAVAKSGAKKIFSSTSQESISDGGTLSVVAFDSTNKMIGAKAIRFERVLGAGNPPETAKISGEKIKLQDLGFGIPSGFRVHQDVTHQDTLILGLTNGSEYLRIYVKRASSIDMNKIFSNGVQVTEALSSRKIGKYDWQLIQTSKSLSSKSSPGVTTYVQGFSTVKDGYVYFGFVKSPDKNKSQSIANSFLGSAL